MIMAQVRTSVANSHSCAAETHDDVARTDFGFDDQVQIVVHQQSEK